MPLVYVTLFAPIQDGFVVVGNAYKFRPTQKWSNIKIYADGNIRVLFNMCVNSMYVQVHLPHKNLGGVNFTSLHTSILKIVVVEFAHVEAK